MSYALNHTGAEIDDLLGFLDANEYKDATVTLDDGSSLSLQNITSGSRLGLIFAVLNRWYQSIVFKSANGDVAISGAGTVGGGLTVTGAISATGGLTIGGGATVNGRVQANSLGVLGDTNMLGELTAGSIVSRNGVYAGGRVWGLVSPQSGTDAATKDYVDSVAGEKVSSVNGQTGAVALDAADVGAVPAMLSGDGAPTGSTAGENGQLYINNITGCVYVCGGETSGLYLWDILAAVSDTDFVAYRSVFGQRGMFEEYKVKRGVVHGIPSYTALNADDVGALPATKNGDVYELTGGLAIGGRLTVHGDSDVLGELTVAGEMVAGSISSDAGVYAGGRVQGVGSPQSGTDAATKDYVDSVAGEKVSSVNGQTGAVALDAADVGAEPSANKVTALSAASTDTQYPSAKCVYDAIATAITGAIEGSY